MKDKILGFFFKVGFNPQLESQDFEDIANEFSPYIWGERGIANHLENLKYQDYGQDLKLILFQLTVKPTLIEIKAYKEIENYRKKEKAIGVPVLVTVENFFCENEEKRIEFLKQIIIKKMDVVERTIQKKKLDTDITKLKKDIINIFHLKNTANNI